MPVAAARRLGKHVVLTPCAGEVRLSRLGRLLILIGVLVVACGLAVRVGSADRLAAVQTLGLAVVAGLALVAVNRVRARRDWFSP
ncbi:hypothetical protein Cch02nite_12720 [Catellatospora chokoriensis]|uniref:Uncharacterized protein n=1 Tax=Catellatospora chokoriensis TaxID=310353 RepID=A0A8J3JZM5_9ACTN|nr:hypothetical protein Cch02nite_12720 [Catellatospora chokoriensis]